MFYFDVILLSDVISSIGPKISDADTHKPAVTITLNRLSTLFFINYLETNALSRAPTVGSRITPPNLILVVSFEVKSKRSVKKWTRTTHTAYLIVLYVTERGTNIYISTIKDLPCWQSAPSQPEEQIHVYDPWVLLQTPFTHWWSAASRHSFVSKNK